MSAPLLIVLAGFAALAYWPMAGQDPGALRSLLKTLSVAALALAALLLGAPLLALALALCALGDFLLSRDAEPAFLAGVGAFAAGHLAYVALFLGHPASRAAQLAEPPLLWAVLALAALGCLVAPALFTRAGPLRWAVLAYVPVILGMGAAALALAPLLGWAVPLSAAAFVLSDLILAAGLFLLRPGGAAARVAPFLVWPLYWGAQAGFFASLGAATL